VDPHKVILQAHQHFDQLVCKCLHACVLRGYALENGDGVWECSLGASSQAD
jgi:hypothetical protein